MRVAILDDYQNVALTMADWSKIEKAADITVFNDHIDGLDAVADRLAPFDVVAIMRERTPFPSELISRLPNLKLLITAGMRNMSIDLAAATEHGLVVCGTENVGVTTAELAWGLILGLARKIPEEDRATRAGHWQTSVGVSVADKTLGIVGLGKVGGHVAKIGLAFGMNVIAWSENLTPERCAELGVQLATKEELFSKSDFISIHLVLSDRTRGLVGRDEFSLMKPSAYLVNTARGPIVQQDALIEALESGAIGGAGIDVYDPEPLPPSHPMRDLPRSIITPHLGFVTDTNYKLWYGQIVEDIEAWRAGEAVRVLNPDVVN